MMNISLKNITKIYPSKREDIVAIKNLSADIDKNEIIAIVGPSGCGKTTIVNLIAGLIRPTAGEILIDGQKVIKPDGKCGVVFQMDSVFPWLTVQQNIGYGLKLNGIQESTREELVDKYLDLIDLRDFADKWPRELSGGMKKRVDLARAYIVNPQILLLDEPFGSLDVFTREEMQMLLLKIWQANRKTILFVTHDVEEALLLANRIIVITQRPGTVKKVFNVPFTMQRDLTLKLTSHFQDLRRQIVEVLAIPRFTEPAI